MLRVLQRSSILLMDPAARTKTKNFLNVCLHEKDFGITAEWNYFATAHDKTSYDSGGEGHEEGNDKKKPPINNH